MRNIFAITLTILLGASAFAANAYRFPNVVISSAPTSPKASALLDLESTTQGFLPPQMTSSQRSAISSPADGLIVYDTTLHVYYGYENGTWAPILAGVSSCGANQVGTSIGSNGAIGCISLTGAYLPNPSSSTLGGIESYASVSHQWINSISTSGVPASTQPAFSDISGNVAPSQLPNPSASTLGGIEAIAASPSKWIDSISTLGVPHQSQPAFSDISGTASGSQLPAINLASGGGGGVTGTLPNSNTTATSAATASTIVARDSNTNAQINNIVRNFATTATAAGVTTLTVSSAPIQYFTGTTTQTVKLPDATSLPQAGYQFYIVNLSTGSVTVQDNGGNIIQVMQASSYTTITARSVSSANGSWDSAYTANSAGGGTVTSVAQTVPSGMSVSGSPITGSGTLAISWSGQIPSTSVPALTGDTTSSAGSTATTAAATQSNITTLSNSSGVAVHGTNTNNNAAAGYVGEYFESLVTRSSAINCNSASTVDVTSLSLTAGDWDISILAQIQNQASWVGISYGISTIATTLPGTAGNNRIDVLAAANSSGDQGWFMTQRLSLSGTTTVYFDCKATSSVLTYGKLLARRMR